MALRPRLSPGVPLSKGMRWTVAVLPALHCKGAIALRTWGELPIAWRLGWRRWQAGGPIRLPSAPELPLAAHTAVTPAAVGELQLALLYVARLARRIQPDIPRQRLHAVRVTLEHAHPVFG